MLDLSIIIVSYNTKEFLKKCLESIVNNVSKEIDYEVIVVDNASKDGTAEMVKERFIARHSGNQASPEHPESIGDSGQDGYQTVTRQARMTRNGNILIIKNRENVGFSRANNMGIKKAWGRFLLFINPDTIVYEKTVDGMVDFMNKTADAGAATCFVELKNGKLDDSCHRGFPTPWRSFCYFTGLSKLFPKSKFFSGYTMTYLNLSETHEIDSLAGSFMIVRRDIGERIGWWDEDFFFYGEDLDFCFRIKELGYKIYFVPRHKALHYKGISSGIKKVSEDISKATKATKLLATKHRFNAMKIFYKKHYKNKYPKIITWVVVKTIDIKQWLTLR